ncbi:MAG TPA: DUF6438 domain-containing protein [Bacteroidia bacterium]|jgi:hypothetical protein
MKFILYSSFLLLLAPCNAPKTSATSTAGSGNNLKTMIIGYEKTVCFGKCPAFTLTINGETNKASYKGDSNVEKMGSYEKNISDEDLAMLSEVFEKNKFFELKDEYDGAMTDLPSKYVSFSYNGKSKKIKDRHNAPAELKEIEKVLDAIADSEGWEKVKQAE